MIPAETLAFLRELAANNDKAWFEVNRERYEAELRQPVAALATAVDAELKRRGVPLEGDAKRSTFRIHRDARFSKDKRPYKTNAGLVWFRPGGSKGSPGVLYAHLDPEGCFVAAAFHHPEPDVLDSIRERIRVHPDRFAAVKTALAGHDLKLDETDMTVRMPKGFEDLKNSPVERAIRLKSFVVRRPLPSSEVHGKALPSKIADLAEHALPLLQFGWAAIDEVAR